jgi:hypothetical protein
MSFSKKINAKKLIEIKNQGRPQSTTQLKYDIENVKKICNLYLNGEGIANIDNDVYIISNYVYSGFPPKTKRLIFRDVKRIRNRSEITNIISQIERVGQSEYKVKIVNKISQSEFINFRKKLRIIDEANFTEAFVEKADDEIRDLIAALSIIDNVRKDFLLEKSRTYDSRVFSLVPVSEKIKNEINKNYNIEHVAENEFLDMNSGNNLEYLDNFFNEFGQFVISVCTVENTKPVFELNNDQQFEKMVLNFNLPKPNYNDVTVGVIDTGFKVPKIFEPWVDGTFCEVSEENREFTHGTTVSSLIIANDELNHSKDGFGHFKVKHFELLGKSALNNYRSDEDSFFQLTKKLRRIIAENSNKIKIWNISFVIGKKFSVFSISKFARILDELSYKYNILFIVASGNYGESGNFDSLGGGPDGVNVLSVGSVERNKKIVRSKYSSIGLSTFLVKPDVATYGGKYDLNGEKFISYDGTKKVNVCGTSYSTPLITRLAAYLLRQGYSVHQIKCRIINMAERMTNSVKASSFGYINHKPDEMRCFNLTGQLNNNRPKILKINLPKVKKMSIAISFFANPANDQLLEYCYHSVEFNVYKNKTSDVITDKNFYDNCKPLKVKNQDYHMFKSEVHQRERNGKYSTVWKKTFALAEDDLGDEHYLYIKLLNLHSNFFDDETVDYSMEIFFEEFGDYELLLKDNEDIIEAEAEAEVE